MLDSFHLQCRRSISVELKYEGYKSGVLNPPEPTGPRVSLMRDTLIESRPLFGVVKSGWLNMVYKVLCNYTHQLSD